MEAVWKGLEPLMRRGTQGTFFKKMIYVHLFSDRSPKSTVLAFAAGELHTWFLALGHFGNLRFHLIKSPVSPLYL